MTQIDLSKLSGWKTFERLTADILEAGGFRIVHEPSVDRSGADILAEEVMASHSGATRLVRWFVQCKHHSNGKSITRKEIEEILNCFHLRTEDGLLIATDTDLSEEASRVLREYWTGRGQNRLIGVWNRREFENRLLQHPTLLDKYELTDIAAPVVSSPFAGANLSGKKILIISDGSPMAYQLFSMLNMICGSVHFITVWQYADSLRCELLLSDLLHSSHDLTIFFLGDSFGIPIPDLLLERVASAITVGKSLIMFPFFAWAVDRGRYNSLNEIIPVQLAKEPRREQLWSQTSRIISRGDLSLLGEAFVENQVVAVSPRGPHPIFNSLPQSFEFIHTFEFLDLKDEASSILIDTAGNPLIVENKKFKQPVLYVNSCMHNCLTRTPMLSPFETSRGYAQLIANTVLWALGLLRTLEPAPLKIGPSLKGQPVRYYRGH